MPFYFKVRLARRVSSHANDLSRDVVEGAGRASRLCLVSEYPREYLVRFRNCFETGGGKGGHGRKINPQIHRATEKSGKKFRRAGDRPTQKENNSELNKLKKPVRPKRGITGGWAFN